MRGLCAAMQMPLSITRCGHLYRYLTFTKPGRGGIGLGYEGEDMYIDSSFE